MDFRHLRAFVTVAEERSFTRAAHRLHISQPPLTRQIRQLEQDLGVALFVRHRTGSEMTREGRALLEKARAINTAVADFLQGVRSIKNPRSRAINVGIGWGLWQAVNLIREHHAKRFPDVPIAAQDLCQEQREPFAEPHIDVAVQRPPVDSQLDSERLFEERFVALLAESHPLASRQTVKLADLAGEPLLLYDRCLGPGVYDKTLALCEAAGVKPQLVERQPPPYAQGAMMLVASREGFYIGIASRFTQTHRAGGVAVVALDEPDAKLDVRIAWRKNESSRNVRDFVCSAREVFPAKREGRRSRLRSA